MDIIKTHRTLTDCETGEVYELWASVNGLSYELHDPQTGERVKNFYMSSSHAVYLLINNTKEVFVNAAQAYKLKPDEVITHRRFFNQRKFAKI